MDTLISECLVPSFSKETARPCLAEDFQEFRNTLTKNLKNLVSLLNSMVQKQNFCQENEKKIFLK